MRLQQSLFQALIIGLALGFGELSTAQQGGIEVFAGETLFEQGTRVSFSHILKRKGTLLQGSDEISDPLDRTRTENRYVVGLDHGIDRDLTLSALIPLVDRELDSMGSKSGSTGLGDVALLAKYRVHRKEWEQSAFYVSLVGGAEVPTGSTHHRSAGMRLAPSLQPGTGAVNPFLALAGTMSVGRARYDALTFYKVNGEGAQEFDPGDFFAVKASAGYRFLHKKYPGPSASAKLGLQWNHTDSASQYGSLLPNSGGEELLGTFGMGWHPVPQLDISLAVDVPLHQNLDGQQLGLDLRTFFAIGIRF